MILVLTGIWTFVLASNVHANGYGSLYNMSELLNQPHPFAKQAPMPQFLPTTIHAQWPVVPRDPKPSDTAHMMKKAVLVENSHSSQTFGWLSEVRGGVLKHAISAGNRTKETGIDGNFEVLFVSPSWLKYILSPRPHIGFSINGSSNNTDYAYGGITWEWFPWKAMFIDFSFNWYLDICISLKRPR